MQEGNENLQRGETGTVAAKKSEGGCLLRLTMRQRKLGNEAMFESLVGTDGGEEERRIHNDSGEDQ